MAIDPTSSSQPSSALPLLLRPPVSPGGPQQHHRRLMRRVLVVAAISVLTVLVCGSANASNNSLVSSGVSAGSTSERASATAAASVTAAPHAAVLVAATSAPAPPSTSPGASPGDGSVVTPGCGDDEGCIPQPGGTTSAPQPAPAPNGSGLDDGGNGDSGDCGLTSVVGCVTQAITDAFAGVVDAALVPLLDLFGQTVLATPTLDQLPGVSDLWNNNWQIVLACYVLFIIVAGILLMAHESVQTRYSLKEIGPRVALGFLASGLSLFAADKAIRVANALAQAVLGQGVAPGQLGDNLMEDFAALGTGSLFVILIGLALSVVALGLLIVYIIRVCVTIMLLISAPLFLMCHALPHTDAIARWWWRSFGLVLAIQIAQSLALVVAIRTVLTSGVRLFSAPITSLGILIVGLAVFWILFRIPFWLLRSIRGGGGHRSLLGSMVRAVIAYKTVGLVGGSSGAFGRRLGTRLAQGFGGGPGGMGGLLFGGRARPRPSGGGGGAGIASTASVAAESGRGSRRWWSFGSANRASRWIEPQPGMLPLTLRRTTAASTVGRARQTLAEQLHDPARRMPWQRGGDPGAPDLFSPEGRVRQHARPVPVRHPLTPPQPGMLPLTLRHSDPIRSRRPLGEQSRPAEQGMRPRSAGLFTSSGRVNPQARPPRVQRPLIPPQPGTLPLTLRPTNSARSQVPTAGQRSVPAHPRPIPQPGLFMPDGRINRNALPRRPTPASASRRAQRSHPERGNSTPAMRQPAGQPPAEQPVAEQPTRPQHRSPSSPPDKRRPGTT
jgi:hypothetical protein